MSKNLMRAAVTFMIVLVLIAVVGKLLALQLPQGSGSSSGGGYGESVALLNIEGVITGDSAGSGPFGAAVGASSVDLCNKLYEIRDDDSIRAVVLRINSPGGSAAASDEIFRAVRAVSKADKPVVASMGDVAASGGYYIAAACDYIYANPATLTGSIGVVFELINWDEAAGKLGIRSETLHAGQYKDIGSPWREMQPDERAAMEAMLKQVHEQFIRAVDEGRQPLDEAGVRKLATGMIYNGEDAAANGLVDSLGGLQEAKVKARALAKLDADAPVEEYGVGSFWDVMFGASASSRQLDPALLGELGAVLAARQALESRYGSAGLGTLSRGLYLNTLLRDLVVR
ncbi:signal peptide peptidase SppA [bacterium]|nr:signal peptide peptidase SppA [bacterium]